jgi:DHA2 family multidrug resistance protein-like MFS transporter
MNNASRELGGAFGVAVLGSLLTTRFDASLAPAIEGLPAPSRAAAETGLAGALEVARGLPGEAGAALADAARVAFVDGFAQAGVVAALLAVTVAAGAYLLLPGARRQPARVVDVDAPDEGADDVAAVTGLPEPAAPAACPVSGR